MRAAFRWVLVPPTREEKEKQPPFGDCFFFSGCGGRTRTYDLRVMRVSFIEKYRIFLFLNTEFLFILCGKA